MLQQTWALRHLPHGTEAGSNHSLCLDGGWGKIGKRRDIPQHHQHSHHGNCVPNSSPWVTDQRKAITAVVTIHSNSICDRVRRHLAHAGGVLYGMELGSVTLNNKHSTHTLLPRNIKYLQCLGNCDCVVMMMLSFICSCRNKI